MWYALHLANKITMTKKRDIEKLKASFGTIKEDGFNFELIGKYFRNKDNSDSFQVLSDKTCNDLDFEELFMFIDRTESKVGQQFLYNTLRTIPLNSKQNELNEKIINELTENVDFRVKIQRHIQKLKKDEVYYISSLFQGENLKQPKWFLVIRLLSFTSLLSLILIPFRPQLIIILIGVFIANLIIHYWNKKNVFQYLGSIPQLLRLNGIANQLYKEKIFSELNTNLRESVKLIDQVKNRMSFFRLEAGIQGDFEVVFWAILEFFKIIFLLEPLLLFGVLKRLNRNRSEIEDVFCFVGQVDTLLSISSLRAGLEDYCLPDISVGKLEVANIYHPLIENCVRNSLILNGKSVLLTGSNMSGKTSFIRTLGLNVITGLTINTCFASSMAFSRVCVYSAIRISDDLMNDKSYYFEEVLTIKEMIDKRDNGKQNLFLLDEIFKGTNTVERISAGKAVLSSLAGNNNIVFVSTHDIELTDMLADDYELYHFSEIVNDKNVDFDYKLKEGKLKNRNAIRILQINDYPDDVIKEAVEISEKLDKVLMN